MTPREDEQEIKSQKHVKKEETIQAKLKTRLKDSILSFWKGKHEQRSLQGIDRVLKIDERVVTLLRTVQPEELCDILVKRKIQVELSTQL